MEDLGEGTASSQGYEWIKDVVYDPLSPTRATEQTIALVTSHGVVLGQPYARSRSGQFYGLYAPQGSPAITELIPELALPIDQDMTPENAASPGYEWARDMLDHRIDPMGQATRPLGA